jgi:hypothetical protein
MDSDVAPAAITLKEYYKHVAMPPHKGDGVLQVGEKLTYRVSCKRAPAGVASLTVKRKITVKGREAFYVAMEVESNRATSLLYRVQDTAKSYIDAQTFSSLLFVRQLKEGTYRSYHEDDYFEFDYAAGLQNLTSMSPEGARRVESRGIPGPLQDPLSVIYYLRNFSLAVGQSQQVLVASEGNPQILSVEVARRDALTLPALGTFDTLVVTLRNGGGAGGDYQTGLFRTKGEIQVWVEMTTRIPLKAMLTMPVVGKTVVQLSHYENSPLSTVQPAP